MPQSRQTLLLFFLALALATLTAAAIQQGGLANDRCTEDEVCKGDLRCRSDTGTSDCVPTSFSCSCVPPSWSSRQCASSSDCVRGERCVDSPVFDFSVCVSCASWSSLLNVSLVDRDGASCLDESNNFLPGFTADACGTTGLSRCVAPRECVLPNSLDPCDPEVELSDAERKTCLCADQQVTLCQTEADCPYGERCVRDGFQRAVCVGCRAIALEPAFIVFSNDTSRCLLPVSTPSPSPAAPSSPNAPYRSGYSFDSCAVDEADPDNPACAEGLWCASLQSILGPSACAPGEVSCFCTASRNRRCTESAQCPLGERCVRMRGDDDFFVCAGCARAARNTSSQDWKPIDTDDNCIPLRPRPSTTASPSPSIAPTPTPQVDYPRGLTFDSCAGERDICREPRLCGAFSRDRPCGRDDTKCACFPPETALRNCTMSAECETGERCVRSGGSGTLCVACSAAYLGHTHVDDGESNCFGDLGEGLEETEEPSPSPEEDALDDVVPVSEFVCIGASHLQSLHPRELVFPTHRVAYVLCDGSGSCATPGHMVVFRGSMMRMRAYCDAFVRGGCSAVRMAVNSPRWPATRRVASRTSGLEFTALAARWESAVEEHVLRVMLRFGA